MTYTAHYKPNKEYDDMAGYYTYTSKGKPVWNEGVKASPPIRCTCDYCREEHICYRYMGYRACWHCLPLRGKASSIYQAQHEAAEGAGATANPSA